MQMKSFLITTVIVVIMSIMLTSCGCKHEWKDATCTEPQPCTKCGKTQGEALVISDFPEHSFGKEVTLKEATCGAEGIIEKTCSICGQVLEEMIPPTERHTYRKGTIVKEATCNRKGEIAYHCVVCGFVGRTEEIDKVDHSFEADKCTNCGTLRIGSTGPAGGYVFYDCDLDNEDDDNDGLVSSECGWRFLEVAPENIGEMVFGYYRYGSDGENLFANGDVEYYEENCTRQEIGYGKSNTKMLVDAMEDEAYVNYKGAEKTTVYAAKACLDYSLNGYNDWFLPSEDELNLMYVNLKPQGKGNLRGDYWSSSECSGRSALEQDFDDGTQYGWSRDVSYYVRPIRAF